MRAADGGVLFLDELGELEPGLQAKLLRGWTGEDAAGESPRARVENLFAALDALEAAARESQRRFEQEIKAIAQASVAELKAAGGDPGRSLQAVVTSGAELAARERALTEEKRALELVRRETGRMQDELVATARDDMIEVLEARKRQLEARLEEARGHDEQIEDQINQIDRQVQALRRKAKNAPKKK